MTLEDDEMGKVIDLETYRRKKKTNEGLGETLAKLDDMSQEVYTTYSEEDILGY